MLKFAVMFSFLISSQLVGAACQNDQVSVEIHLSNKTTDAGSEFGSTNLTSTDQVIIKDILAGVTWRYSSGTFEDDGFGNFGVTTFLMNLERLSLMFFHDHETWHTEGNFTALRF